MTGDFRTPHPSYAPHLTHTAGAMVPTRAKAAKRRLRSVSKTGRHQAIPAGDAACTPREGQMNGKLLMALIVATLLFLAAPALAG